MCACVCVCVRVDNVLESRKSAISQLKREQADNLPTSANIEPAARLSAGFPPTRPAEAHVPGCPVRTH